MIRLTNLVSTKQMAVMWTEFLLFFLSFSSAWGQLHHCGWWANGTEAACWCHNDIANCRMSAGENWTDVPLFHNNISAVALGQQWALCGGVAHLFLLHGAWVVCDDLQHPPGFDDIPNITTSPLPTDLLKRPPTTEPPPTGAPASSCQFFVAWVTLMFCILWSGLFVY